MKNARKAFGFGLNGQIKRILCNTVIILFAFQNGYSQTDTSSLNTYEGLSLKDLLNIRIVSVSKKSELLFDAPLSASVITREDIRRAGSTSIMEALRLVPGMIVREQSNGNYDIYIRGMDNVPPNSTFDGNSTTTLVMLNNRPIYNYLKGGTFWETLPVDLNDVEKIEVIRGPAAALYGPNAVSGVINIITREITKQGLYLIANAQQGTQQTVINNASLGYRFNKRWSAGVSGNYQKRDRTQTSYFEIYRNEWLEDPEYLIGFIDDTVKNVDQLYPYPQLAMKKYAGNAFLSYAGSDKMNFEITSGMQRSLVQKVSTENGITPLTTVSSNSHYANLRAQIKSFSAQISYNAGTQVPNYQAGNKYDFITFDANAEYNYTRGNLSVKPGISYRSAVYDDTRYTDTVNKTGIFNARGRLVTQSASLRGEYHLFDGRARVVAGIMSSTFNYPDTTYLSYELAATYKLNIRHLLRMVYSSAPRSSNIYDTYVDQRVGLFPTGVNKFMLLQAESNKSLKLLTASMFEIGYRGQITPVLHIDAEVYNIHSKNYSSVAINSAYTMMRGTDTIVVAPFKPTNLPLTLLQQGITVSLSYGKGKIQAKPFITVQQSYIRDYSHYMNTPDAAVIPSLSNDPAANNIYSGIGTRTKVRSTPAAFGGATVNYTPAAKWNINLSAYYYSDQTYYHISNLAFDDGVRGIDHIQSKFIINTNVSYEPVKGLHVFCTGKNLLGNRSREFFRSDNVPFMLLGGLNYEF